MQTSHRSFILGCLCLLTLIVGVGFLLPQDRTAPPAPINAPAVNDQPPDTTHTTPITNEPVLAADPVVDIAPTDPTTDTTVSDAPSVIQQPTTDDHDQVTATESTDTDITTDHNTNEDSDLTPTVTTATLDDGSATTHTENSVRQVALPQQSISVPLQIVGGAVYTVDVPVGSSVETVMQAAHAQGLSYSTKQFGGMGSYVTAINGRVEDTDAGMYWILYINSVKSTIGMSSATVQAGDVVQWQYEKGY